jgi:NMD protein affecting ribosome stability and mRNA decay
MKALIEAATVDGQVSAKHEIEIFCPNCTRDVDTQELSNQVCNDCGFDLSEPKQNVAIHVTTLPPAGGGVM